MKEKTKNYLKFAVAFLPIIVGVSYIQTCVTENLNTAKKYEPTPIYQDVNGDGLVDKVYLHKERILDE